MNNQLTETLSRCRAPAPPALGMAQELRIGYVSGERACGRLRHMRPRRHRLQEAEFSEAPRRTSRTSRYAWKAASESSKDAPTLWRPNAASASATWSIRTASSTQTPSSRKT